MKAKFTISHHSSLDALCEAAKGVGFYISLFRRVADTLEIEAILDRPAEYYGQEPDLAIVVNPDVLGVTFQLTGISRDGRSTANLMSVYEAVCGLVTRFVQDNVKQTADGPAIQVTVSFALDGQIEYARGRYVSLIDGYATILNGKQVDLVKPRSE